MFFLKSFSFTAQDIESVTFYVDEYDNVRMVFDVVCDSQYFRLATRMVRVWEIILQAVNQYLDNAVMDGVVQTVPKWKTIAYNTKGDIVPVPESLSSQGPTPTPAATTAHGIPLVAAPLALTSTSLPSRLRATIQEILAAIPNEGITPTDLMYRLNETHYLNNPFHDPNECLEFNKVWDHLVLDNNNMLKLIGHVKLILEWA